MTFVPWYSSAALRAHAQGDGANCTRQGCQSSFCSEPKIHKKSCCSLARTSSTHTEQLNLCAEAFHWETPLQIIQYPDPRLRAENTPITTFDSTLEAFAADMFDAMYDGWVLACVWGLGFRV